MVDRNHYHHFYNTADPKRWGRTEMPQQEEITRYWLSQFDQHSCAVVVELGCGVGSLSHIHSGYIGMEYSLLALSYFTPAIKRVNGDMQYLPFRNESVDFIFSWAALEHVPYPELALTEIERVLKSGGIVLLAPAWNVRPWAAKGLFVRPALELSWQEKLTKMTIPLRNTLFWRSMFTFPHRLRRELLLRFRHPLDFDYRRLAPNLTKYLDTDSDAFTSMDAHAALIYFKSRGWDILSHARFVDRIFARHDPVVVRKVP